MSLISDPRLSRLRRDLICSALLLLLLLSLVFGFDQIIAESDWHTSTLLFRLSCAITALAILGWFAWRRADEYGRAALLHEQTADELRASQSRYAELLESARDRFWESDEHHRVVWRSEPAGRTAPDDAFLYKTRWDAIGIDLDKDPYWAAHHADLENHRPFRNFRYTKMKFGRVVHRSLSGHPFFDAEGKFRGYRGTATDITREVEARKNAAEIQTQFLSAMENIADGYALWSSEDTLITCNERFARLHAGISLRDQSGITFEAFVQDLASTAEEDGPQVTALLEWHRKPNAPLHIRHGGRWIEMREHHLADGQTLLVTHDISEQKELENQLQQAQKMKAVGQLTGGIAHDFNNLLQVIIGNIEMIIEQTPPGSKTAGWAAVAKTASERGADLIRRLMAFSRQQSLQPKVFDLNHMVTEMSEIARRTLGEDITIHTNLAADLPQVYLDRVQAEAAFLNLAINARDAMPNGGSLFIDTAEIIQTEEETSHQIDLQPGRYVLLSVTDTGIGMTPDVLARAVEPFFTTKEVGKGTGLGLSMTYGFIKQSGGDVKIYSEPGIGTALKLYLPIAREHSAESFPTASPAPDLKGNETILLVEDEEPVRNYAAAQLASLGYQVIAAADGASALHRIMDLDGSVDLLFTDIVMPGGMNGRQLAQHVAALYPSLKVLYTSGYNQNAIVQAGRLEAGIALLEKPYHKTDLARKVRDLLDNPRQSDP